jgi:hypothetical protein
MGQSGIEIIHPCETSDLIRIGQLKDGGYVINKRVFDTTRILIGLGINADWSFEEDFVRHGQKDIRVYGYDFSVSKDLFVKEHMSRILYLFSIKFLLRLLKSPGKIPLLISENYGFAKKAGKAKREFPVFFNGTRNKFFQLGISNEKTGHFVRFDDVIHNLDTPPSPLSIFLKIDIEFSEYRILNDVLKYSDLICGMAIEFHELDVVWEQFCRIREEIGKDFVLTHIHGNNYGGSIPGTHIPMALEATFLHKKLLKEEPRPSSFKYPLPGLDYLNDPSKADLPIDFGK